MNQHSRERPKISQIVDVDWLLEHLADPDVRVIDARSLGQFQTGHIPGAGHSDQNLLRLENSSEESIRQFQRLALSELRRLGINNGERVIFYEDFSGASAARGVWLLDYLGIPGAAMLDGGLGAWTRAGGGISDSSDFHQPGTVEMSINPGCLSSASELLHAIGNPENATTILDTRSDLEFQLSTIPTSFHLEWKHHLNESGTFRTVEELAELYRSHGMSPDDGRTVVTFCGGGYRAAHTYLVLKMLGFNSVKNYAPSWGEWGARGDLPKERPSRR